MRLFRHIGRSLIFLFIVSILIFSVSVIVLAELKSDILFTINETRNMAITVSYSKEIPLIGFIAPNGEKFYDGVPENKMTVEHSEGVICYLIPNAMPGDWLIEYDKLSNETIDVTYAPYAETVKIENFAVESISESTAYIKFDVSYINDTNFEYIVYAAITDENSSISGQKELLTGSASTNQTTSVRVPLSSLTSYDKYHLMLEVYLESGGIEVFDTAVIEESFSFDNSRTPSEIKDFYTEIDLTEGSLLIDWTENYIYNCQEYIVAVYTSENKDEPMFYSTYAPDVTSTGLLIDTSLDSIRVEVLYRKDGVTSKAAVKDIYLDTGTMISISTGTETNSAQAIINYDSRDSIPVVVTVNGNSETVNISGKGYFSVEIDEFTNEIQVSYSTEKNICFIVKADIYSDRTPPILLLYENKSTFTTAASSYILAGETEPGCTLTINNDIFAINEDGTFLHDLKLSAGDNLFTVKASDIAGNSAMQTINIRRSNSAASNKGNFTFKNFLPLVITFILSVILIICVLLFTRTYAKKVPKGRLKAILTVLRNTFAVITPIIFAPLIFLFFIRRSATKVINSPEYFNLVQKSVSEAYEAINKYEKINTLFVIALIVFGTSLLITILLSWLLRSLKPPLKALNDGQSPY